MQQVGGGAFEMVKAARRLIGVRWKGCRKTAPKIAVFCHLFKHVVKSGQTYRL